MGYSHGNRWNDELIISGIKNVMRVLNINRMPSKSETEIVLGNRSLSCAISKKGFYEWADRLGLEVKKGETQTGKGFEAKSIEILTQKGYKVERMSTKYAFDLLVNDKISVDVKAARPYLMKGSRVHTVGIGKKYATCDLYLIFSLDEHDEPEKTYIIPGCNLKLTSMNFGTNSKYDVYLDRWDYFEKYNSFYSKLA